MPRLRLVIIETATIAAIGVVLAALGPFDTFALGDFARRLAYWLPLTLAGYVLFRPLAALAEAMADRLDLPRVATLVAAVLLAAIPMTLVVALAGGYRPGALPPFDALFGLYERVVILAGIVTFLLVVADGRKARPDAVGAPPAPDLPPSAHATAPAPFLSRLPPAWSDRLVALEMEDHYVRAHGEGGQSVLLLMRMRDAIVELGGIEGERVHRSWWVARHAVRRARRDGRNWRLSLAGGHEVPVARDRAAALRSAGWF